MYEVKAAIISNFWTFWPIIQLIGQNVQKMLIWAVLALYIASILNKSNYDTLEISISISDFLHYEILEEGEPGFLYSVPKVIF